MIMDQVSWYQILQRNLSFTVTVSYSLQTTASLYLIADWSELFLPCCVQYASVGLTPLHIGTSLTFFKNMIVPCESPPNLHLATSEMRCWSGRREILTELSLCYSIVYQCNVAEWYEQFLQVSRPDQALILPGIALYLPSTSIFLLYGAIYTVVQKKRANFGGL